MKELNDEEDCTLTLAALLKQEGAHIYVKGGHIFISLDDEEDKEGGGLKAEG